MMPVGIQMFATITSKDHVRHIQQDLQNMYFSDMYRQEFGPKIVLFNMTLEPLVIYLNKKIDILP